MRGKMGEYKLEMELDNWIFHNLIDENQKNRFFGKKDDYLVFIDIDKGMLELWYKDKDWVIEPPEKYSFEEIQYNTYKCDTCGEIQADEYDLNTVNQYLKYCQKCVKQSLL